MTPQSAAGVEVVIEDEGWSRRLADAPARIETWVRAALGGVSGEVAVLLTSDEAMRVLNRDLRGRDRPTNVLSFPAHESAAPHLGDIALGLGTCEREALEQGKSLEAHLAHLVVHGTLHLLGHDHETDDEAEAMEALERTILAGMGVSDPYAVSP
ncbi:MAG: rRNA maturation RNase YbeY [Brevundimonas sp.]|jgi:probable rRNA maturation factor|uniref:rRNA maturation RNase YbeY n=1 Tax=Brevundimonas sp. TaxID=1871086 RepID=UPI00391D5A64